MLSQFLGRPLKGDIGGKINHGSLQGAGAAAALDQSTLREGADLATA